MVRWRRTSNATTRAPPYRPTGASSCSRSRTMRPARDSQDATCSTSASSRATLLPVAFPMVMAMGGMLALMGISLPGIEYGIAASAIMLGAAVLFEVRPPVVVAAIVVGVLAIFHGHAHGTELPPGQ